LVGGDGAVPAPAPSGCWLSRLALSNFRCYEAAELQLDHRPVVLAGANGAGKTNLLEAISFLAPGRGLRAARLSEIDRRPPGESDGAESPLGPGWSVAARVMTPEGPRDLGTGREAGAAQSEASGELRERRAIKIDGAYRRGQQALGEVVRMVWLTPRMDGLFRDGPSGRRRFLDRLVTGFDAGHSGRLAAYEQARPCGSARASSGPAPKTPTGSRRWRTPWRATALPSKRRDAVSLASFRGPAASPTAPSRAPGWSSMGR
jgi:DNA replication and repair protein RecF